MNDLPVRTEDRQALLTQFERNLGREVTRGLRRMILTYDRYAEADRIAVAILNDQKRKNFSGMTVMDFGCGAGDYGITFARLGAERVCYSDENPEAMAWAEFRHSNEPIVPATIVYPDDAIGKLPAGGYDVAVFGEVLEHLVDPLEVLRLFSDAGTKYLFTSSYPYRPDDARHEYWAHCGHTHAAREAQPACRELLESRYEKIANFGRVANVWRIRGYSPDAHS